MKRKGASQCDEYMLIVRQAGGHYEVRRWKAATPIKAFVIGGHKYRVQKEKAFLLKGWYPWTQIRFFQSILDALSHWVNRIGLLVYEEPPYQTDSYVSPLDRIDEIVTSPGPGDILTPDVHRVIAESKIYADAMKKLHFGGGMSWKTGTIVLAAMLFLMLVLYLGGYFE